SVHQGEGVAASDEDVADIQLLLAFVLDHDGGLLALTGFDRAEVNGRRGHVDVLIAQHRTASNDFQVLQDVVLTRILGAGGGEGAEAVGQLVARGVVGLHVQDQVAHGDASRTYVACLGCNSGAEAGSRNDSGAAGGRDLGPGNRQYVIE